MEDRGTVPADQLQAVVRILQDLFQDHLLAACLHGSAVLGRLRPRSDLDILAIIDSPMTPAQRRELVSALLEVSMPYPAPPGNLRCIELMVFQESEVSSSCYPATAELVYGEWLRAFLESGEPPMPVADPGNTLTLAQSRQHSRVLLGSTVREIVSAIPATRVGRAMRDALPALLRNLAGDERNVLLTLARMWRTGATGDFVPKDIAATWAIPFMPEREAQTLAFARDAYLGAVRDTWAERQPDTLATADHLHQRVLQYV